MKRALVIEDDEDIRRNICDILEMEGYHSESAADGLLGLRQAQHLLPDLIICDIMMPGLDGYGVLAELRRDPMTAAIPFIFLSARSSRDDLRHGMELGANDYVTKPFTTRDLLAAIDARLTQQAAITRQFQAKFDDLRDNLSLMMPHELRTPLVGILGGAEFLKDDWENMNRAEVNHLLDIVTVSGRRLARLVENHLLLADLMRLRDAARTDSIPWLRAAHTPNTRTVIENAALNAATSAQRLPDLKLTLNDLDDVPVLNQHLDKIVAELVDNACKFSPKGSPVSVAGQMLPTGDVRLAITDQGRGLKPAQIANIGAYQQFERKTYEQQGAGLGLTLARLLAELYGGDLSIDSRVGGPTTVLVTLPTQKDTRHVN